MDRVTRLALPLYYRAYTERYATALRELAVTDHFAHRATLDTTMAVGLGQNTGPAHPLTPCPHLGGEGDEPFVDSSYQEEAVA